MKIFIFLTAIAICSFACKGRRMAPCKESSQHYNRVDSDQHMQISVDSFDISHLRKAFKDNGFYVNGGFQIYRRNDNAFVVFMDAIKQHFIFVNLFDTSDVRLVATNQFTDIRTKFTWRIENDIIHFIDNASFIYYTFSFQLDSLEVQSKVSLSNLLRSNKLFLNDNLLIDKKILISYPIVYFTYGNFFTLNNADENLLLQVDLQKMQMKKILQYPPDFHERPIYSCRSQLEKLDDERFAVLFQKQDKIYIVDEKSGVMLRETDSIPFQSRFMCFDPANGSDLAYRKRFSVWDEENSNLIFSKGMLYQVKRLRRDDRSLPVRSAILIYDRSL